MVWEEKQKQLADAISVEYTIIVYDSTPGSLSYQNAPLRAQRPVRKGLLQPVLQSENYEMLSNCPTVRKWVNVIMIFPPYETLFSH